MNSVATVAGVGTSVLLLGAALAGCAPHTPPRSAGDAAAHTVELAHVNPDSALAARVLAAIKADPAMREAEIQVTVSEGRARLSGFVGNAAAKLRAAELAQQATGVVGVENRLILRYHVGLTPGVLGEVRFRI
jgi:osmotically-inducible protein OsmY